MKRHVRSTATISFAAAALSLFALSGSAVALPTCAQLATDPAFGLAGNPQVSGLTAVLLPTGVTPPPFPGFPGSPFTAYCKVDFTFSGESGPSAGYLPGQSQQLKIRVGLPPNSLDLAGANAFNWDRFITAELWPAVVMNQEVGAPIASAKLNAVTNAALIACDAQDTIPGDGIIQDPRACTYSATAFVCKANGGPSSDPSCLTPPEASAVNKIWDGPSDANGNRAWYGLERGASLSGLAGTNPFSIANDHFKYWIHQNASFDWHTVTEASFFTDMLTSIAKFNDVIGTDDDLKAFRKAGGKMITYHGLSDTLIPPRGTYHYYNSVLQGNYKETQKFYRFFPYPGNGHCGGVGAPASAGVGAPQINGEALFTALVNWVENGVAPDYIVASQTTPIPVSRTRKVCMYPNEPVYGGSGSRDDQANFTCEERKKDDLIDTLMIGRPFETSTKANTD